MPRLIVYGFVMFCLFSCSRKGTIDLDNFHSKVWQVVQKDYIAQNKTWKNSKIGIGAAAIRYRNYENDFEEVHLLLEENIIEKAITSLISEFLSSNKKLIPVRINDYSDRAEISDVLHENGLATIFAFSDIYHNKTTNSLLIVVQDMNESRARLYIVGEMGRNGVNVYLDRTSVL